MIKDETNRTTATSHHREHKQAQSAAAGKGANHIPLTRSKSVELWNTHLKETGTRRRAWSDGALELHRNHGTNKYISPKLLNRRKSIPGQWALGVQEPTGVRHLEKEVNALRIPNQRTCSENARLRIHRFVKRTYKHSLVRLGLYQYAREVNYLIRQLTEAMFAVIPLALYLVLFIAIFFQEGVDRGGEIAGGMISMIFGLLLFLEGIKISVMPMGEIIGGTLPGKYHLSVFLGVCFCLGVLTTFAEPAIATLRPLAALVEADRTPLLYKLLNDWRQFLVLAIGLGVGISTAVGAWRMLTKRPLLPQVCIVLIPAVVIACYMMWGDPNLRSLIGLAWDCGALPTGKYYAQPSGLEMASNGIINY